MNAFIGAGRPLGRLMTAGLEATVSDAGNARQDIKFLSGLATVGIRGGPRVPAWGTLGLGWLFWSGPGPNSNGPALSVRAGVDFPVIGRLAVSPYAGYVTMLGHDGPHHVQDIVTAPEGLPTRVSSLQLGVAATLKL